MSPADILFVAMTVVLSTATAFLIVGLYLLRLAKNVVKQNLSEMALWQSVQAEKLAKVEKDIVAHAHKIDQYFQEIDDWGSKPNKGGTH